MSKTHLQVAHEYGVKKALEKCGYVSPEAVAEDVKALGLEQKSAEKAAADTRSLDTVMSSLKAKLG